MKRVARADRDSSGGYTSIDQWYVKYPDGTLREFKIPGWDGISRIERRANRSAPIVDKGIYFLEEKVK